MITVEKALQVVLDHTRILEPTSVPILQAIGMVLAEDIISSEDIPPLRYGYHRGICSQKREYSRQ